MFLIMFMSSLVRPVIAPRALDPVFVHVVSNRCIVRPLEQGRGSVKTCPGGAL